jgi:hypothetical protein
MKLEEFLSEKREAILKRWFNAVVETYPADTSNFLKAQKNPFANPVGNAISEGLDGVFGALLGDGEELDSKGVSPFLDSIIRVRAVQGFTASQAVSFVFSLGEVIIGELEDSGYEPSLKEISALLSRIDRLALLSFDIYMGCREKLYEAKSNEVRNRTFRLLQRANLISGEEPALTDNNNKEGVDG